MTIETAQQQVALRSKKLTECVEAIRGLENRELQTRCSWAYICVQLGEQFQIAKEVWKDSDKNGERLWKQWVENHSRHSYRSIAVFMSMYQSYDAANEVQKTALLEAGTISGFLEKAKEMNGEQTQPKQSPLWLTWNNRLSQMAENLQPIIGEMPDESAEKFCNDLKTVVSAAKERWPAMFV
jgi:hypothetical protein